MRVPKTNKFMAIATRSEASDRLRTKGPKKPVLEFGLY